MVTSKGKLIDTPFSLGFEGEKWEPGLPGLYVPVGAGAGVAVICQNDGSAVVTLDKWAHFDSLLMAAAYVQTLIAEGSQK